MEDGFPMLNATFLLHCDSSLSAVVGVVGEFVAAVLFWVEYRIQKRKESYRQSHGVFTLEGTKA